MMNDEGNIDDANDVENGNVEEAGLTEDGNQDNGDVANTDQNDGILVLLRD